MVVQKTKKRSRGKAAAVGVEVNGSSSSDDAKGRTCVYVSNNLSTNINHMIILHGRVTQILQEGDYIVEECFKVEKSQRSALLFGRSAIAELSADTIAPTAAATIYYIIVACIY